ncbi:hypothetical protein [Xanthomonas hortorum]|uniref:Uncharacterized protein n=3 Tax=Xanthomonas hortorum TaxID=56454 RepID=A0AAW9ZT04_9XANT|nr:hypothetical protein [Xanthomonas hortorum]MCE4354477.1 hypothetical protein [Xanthomonas hortorum pv. pelargonii]MCM5522575.1 hypothetical protein [Xanthomonas hortorum pv. pelargonii]MCM5534499.1 hypothetical protein [Xanthomonas hortorum pv. pelargonii]MCM5539356.1 hypothetical protein [Xanthomonas hortorum pv. pelargonii]MCM5543122.1 hypothetical protein [Xanthomonas hortorum pv. pelargonii]
MSDLTAVLRSLHLKGKTSPLVKDMPAVKLAAAKDLVAAGVMSDAIVLGADDGYAVQLLARDHSRRLLISKLGEPRTFAGIEAAAKALHQIGIHSYRVDNTQKADPANNVRIKLRKRADQQSRIAGVHKDAAYLRFLTDRTRSAVEAADANPADSLTGQHARDRLQALKQQARKHIAKR